VARRQTQADSDAAKGLRPGRPLGFDRDEAVDAITQAFWQHGWAETSTPVLEAATGLSRSSLANSFGTKQQMLATALNHYNELIANHLVADLQNTSTDPEDALHGFFDSLAALKADGPGQYGCLAINTLVELLDRDKAIDGQITRYEQMLLAGFSSALSRIQDSAHPDLEPRAHALLALAMAINLHARNRDRAKVTATTAAAHALLRTW
jgi:TetR/AcrR family transcriptional regulator, transcriptional repressor for nem operon